MSNQRAAWALLLILASVAVGLRVAGIDYGLPHVFNADEPHHVNVAVSFGRGTLNPGVFKYPTLWMYALFGAYGAFFILWSGLGLAHTVREFGELFVRDPSAFYLIARASATVFSLLGVWRVYKAGEASGRRLGLWAACFLAVSPTLVVSAHAAKPESLMFFLSAAAMGAALTHLQTGKKGFLYAAAVFAGLATSAQYNAAPLTFVVLGAWWARRIGGNTKRLRGSDATPLLGAGLAAAAAFIAGTPYALLTPDIFIRDLNDHVILNGLGTPAGAVALYNAARFGGHALFGGTFLLLGMLHLSRKDRPRFVLLGLPVAAQILFIASAPEGTWERYLLAAFPFFALIAAYGVEDSLVRLSRVPVSDYAVRAVMAGALVLPGAVESWSFDRGLMLPDTRTLSTQWFNAHVAEGSSVLMDNDHASPLLRRSVEQARYLLEKTKAAGHPRARYYDFMVSGHPGGGYRLYQILRDYSDLHSGKWHVQWSAEGRSMVDVRAGLAAARAAGIEYVVLSSFGAREDRSQDMARFFEEVRTQGELLREFREVSGVVAGPRIRIFKI